MRPNGSHLSRSSRSHNMLKPLLDVLEGIIYENDCLIFEIYARKLILSAQAVAVPDSVTKVDVTITPN
jgi:Holliday junction resolvase RusA-like endonuclease